MGPVLSICCPTRRKKKLSEPLLGSNSKTLASSSPLEPPRVAVIHTQTAESRVVKEAVVAFAGAAVDSGVHITACGAAAQPALACSTTHQVTVVSTLPSQDQGAASLTDTAPAGAAQPQGATGGRGLRELGPGAVGGDLQLGSEVVPVVEGGDSQAGSAQDLAQVPDLLGPELPREVEQAAETHPTYEPSTIAAAAAAETPTADLPTTAAAEAPTADLPSADAAEAPTADLPSADAAEAPIADLPSADAAEAPTADLPSADAAEAPTADLPSADAAEAPTADLPSADAAEAPTADLPSADAAEAPTADAPTPAVSGGLETPLPVSCLPNEATSGPEHTGPCPVEARGSADSQPEGVATAAAAEGPPSESDAPVSAATDAAEPGVSPLAPGHGAASEVGAAGPLLTESGLELDLPQPPIHEPAAAPTVADLPTTPAPEPATVPMVATLEGFQPAEPDVTLTRVEPAATAAVEAAIAEVAATAEAEVGATAEATVTAEATQATATAEAEAGRSAAPPLAPTSKPTPTPLPTQHQQAPQTGTAKKAPYTLPKATGAAPPAPPASPAVGQGSKGKKKASKGGKTGAKARGSK